MYTRIQMCVFRVKPVLENHSNCFHWKKIVSTVCLFFTAPAVWLKKDLLLSCWTVSSQCWKILESKRLTDFTDSISHFVFYMLYGFCFMNSTYWLHLLILIIVRLQLKIILVADWSANPSLISWLFSDSVSNSHLSFLWT